MRDDLLEPHTPWRFAGYPHPWLCRTGDRVSGHELRCESERAPGTLLHHEASNALLRLLVFSKGGESLSHLLLYDLVRRHGSDRGTELMLNVFVGEQSPSVLVVGLVRETLGHHALIRRIGRSLGDFGAHHSLRLLVAKSGADSGASLLLHVLRRSRRWRRAMRVARRQLRATRGRTGGDRRRRRIERRRVHARGGRSVSRDRRCAAIGIECRCVDGSTRRGGRRSIGARCRSRWLRRRMCGVERGRVHARGGRSVSRDRRCAAIGIECRCVDGGGRCWSIGARCRSRWLRRRMCGVERRRVHARRWGRCSKWRWRMSRDRRCAAIGIECRCVDGGGRCWSIGARCRSRWLRRRQRWIERRRVQGRGRARRDGSRALLEGRSIHGRCCGRGRVVDERRRVRC